MSDLYADCGLDLSRPVEKAAWQVDLNDMGLDVPARPVRKSSGQDTIERTVQKGSLADCGLFKTVGRAPCEVDYNDIGLESGKEFTERQVRKAAEARAKAAETLAKMADSDVGLAKGGIESRLERLLRRLDSLFTTDERDRAKKAIRALDIAAFCDIAESAWSRRPC